MKLPLADLRALNQKMLDYLEAQGYETLELSQEYGENILLGNCPMLNRFMM